MAESFEVEVKFPLSGSGAQTVTRLTELGAVGGESIVQSDHYFNHPVRDFAQTDEALRIRSVENQNWVTWKGPKVDAETKTRREIELPLGHGTQTAEQLAEVLQILSFRSVAVVRKTRRCFHLKRGTHNFEIAFDEVDGIGRFLEIELVATPDDVPVAQTAVLELAKELNLTDSESRSYLAMVLEQSEA